MCRARRLTMKMSHSIQARAPGRSMRSLREEWALDLDLCSPAFLWFLYRTDPLCFSRTPERWEGGPIF